jgi:peptidyl-prolyl cis-trans isomerase C
MSSSLLRTSVLATAMLVAVVPALAKDKAEKAEATGSVLATVNGKAIPKSRADAMLAAQVAQGQADTEDLRKAIREELIRREVLAQEAQKKGLDKKPDIVGQMDLARQGVLLNAYMGEYVRTHPVSDEALKKEYETIRSQLGDKEFKARHILVDKEDDAKAIIDKLNKGEKFEDLAKQSKDPGSKERGGDLGWAAPTSYVKPFADALVALQKGKYSATPVKSDFGYHVILLEDSRDLKAPAFDEVKQQLSQRLQQQIIEKHIAELRGKSKVD